MRKTNRVSLSTLPHAVSFPFAAPTAPRNELGSILSKIVCESSQVDCQDVSPEYDCLSFNYSFTAPKYTTAYLRELNSPTYTLFIELREKGLYLPYDCIGPRAERTPEPEPVAQEYVWSRSPSPLPIAIWDPERLKHAPTFRAALLHYRPKCTTPPWPACLTKRPRCPHSLRKSRTFTTGETISLCADCGKAWGSKALRVVNFFQADKQIASRWEERLDAANLSVNRAMVHQDLLFGDLSQLTTQTGRVTTSGATGTDRDGTRNDSSMRDRRAKRRRRRDERRVPPVKITCLYSECGKSFFSRKGTKHCCKQHQKSHWYQLNSKQEKKEMNDGNGSNDSHGIA